MVIISGVAFGGETGFLVGAMTMLASNVLMGQGPWTPYQMFAMGIIGFLAGILFRKMSGTLGSVGQIPCELSLEPHLHFDVQVNGDYVDPASLVE